MPHSSVVVNAEVPADLEFVLSEEALAFLAALHHKFDQRRRELLVARPARATRLVSGDYASLPAESGNIRELEWQVAPAPADLIDRRVEITGPPDRKMVINAMNSGAKVFMVDFEDAMSPTWTNVIDGQRNLYDAVRRAISFTNPDGREYQLNDTTATLVIRPRGLHLPEAHLTVDGEPLSASLVDFGLSFFHNANEQLQRGAGPYYYLPKLESSTEAKLWNDVFTFAEARLGVSYGSVRATVLIETILAAFQMEEILYELRDHAAGLNAGRWDYIFSMIKTFRDSPDHLLPDRAQVTMTVPFMHNYTELLVQTCHKRGAHAIGGMAAFIPNRRDPDVTTLAMAKVKEDKDREAGAGFDGTWVAHPDLVELALASFDAVLGDLPNQKVNRREDVSVSPETLVNLAIAGGQITDAGFRMNISVAIQYVDAWLRGNGAAAINNLMEDAATAEISRAQLWQWIRHNATTDDGQPITKDRFKKIRQAEVAKLPDTPIMLQAATLLDELVESEEFTPFLTLPAYELLIQQS